MRHGSLFTATQKGVENGHVGSEGEERDTDKYKERMRGGERERERDKSGKITRVIRRSLNVRACKRISKGCA